MKSLPSKLRIIHGVITCCFLVVAFLPPAHAQIEALKKAVGSGETAKPQAPETPQEERKRIETWQQEARDTLSRLEAAGTTVALPEGITGNELDDRRRDLEQMVLTTTEVLKNPSAADDARKAAETARAEDSAWSGFKDPPPYSILMLDELLNERDAVEAKLISNEAALANFERLLASYIVETKAAEESASAAMIAVQNATADKADAAKWRLETARAKARLLVTRAAYMQASCGVMKDRITADKAGLSLVERQIKTATPQTRFSEEDLTKIAKISDERKKSVGKELTDVSKRLKSARAARTEAQAALEAMIATSTGGKETGGLELAKFRLEVADRQIESLQTMTESLESLVQLENLVWQAHKDRHTLITTAKPEDRAKALESISVTSDRLRAWRYVVDNELSNCGADLSKIESRAASITTEDPRFALVNAQRAACSEELAMLQRASQAVATQRKILRRWVADYSPKPEDAGFYNQVTTAAAKSWDTVKSVWSYEVMNFDNKVEVDGQTLTSKNPVTLGTLLRALLFFIIGYWITSLIANRIQHTLTTRGHIAEAQAKTLRNWAMIAVGVFLVIGTLSFLKIPLTVFAFFGGALAIGLGFGMQTLIKNFISGIIVLAERKVRVGDILDVDGIVGTVTEINTRSSIIRGPDDVETMIPNSVFLENRVTNWTLSSGKVRRSLRVGVAYGSHPQKVMEILTESAGRHGLILKDPAPFAVFEDFGDNALIFSLYFWVHLGGSTNAMIVTSDLRLMIEKRFTETGIGVPFPQRDMHLTTDKPIQVQLAPAPETKPDPCA